MAEETGNKANELRLLGSYLINNRRSDMKMHIVLATNLEKFYAKPDPEEDIETFWVSEKELEPMIKDGQICNNHTLAAWTLYKLNA